jgi:hypothetical protein
MDNDSLYRNRTVSASLFAKLALKLDEHSCVKEFKKNGSADLSVDDTKILVDYATCYLIQEFNLLSKQNKQILIAECIIVMFQLSSTHKNEFRFREFIDLIKLIDADLDLDGQVAQRSFFPYIGIHGWRRIIAVYLLGGVALLDNNIPDELLQKVAEYYPDNFNPSIQEFVEYYVAGKVSSDIGVLDFWPKPMASQAE